MSSELLKQLGLVQEDEDNTPIMLRNPNVVESSVNSNIKNIVPETNNQQQTAEGLMGNLAVPREANYIAPRIEIPTNADNSNYMKELDDRLVSLQDSYKKELADAEDRKFKSQVWSAIGNALPGVVAGATAMNTKASVSPAKLDKIEVSDPTSRVDSKYKTDYEGMLQRYKTLKDGQLTPKDVLQARIAQSYLEQGASRLNANVENTDRNAGIRVGSAILKDQKENELSDKQVDKDTEMANTLDEIKRVTDQAKNFKDKLGPNAALYEKAKEGRLGVLVPGAIDEKYVKFRSDSKALKGQYQKIISGLTLSDQERAELNSYVPNEEMPYETFKASAEAFERRVRELRNKTNQNIKQKQGKNVDGYSSKSSEKTEAKREYSPSRNQTRITYSDGTVEIKDGK